MSKLSLQLLKKKQPAAPKGDDGLMASPTGPDTDSAATGAAGATSPTQPTSTAYMRVLKDYSLLMEYKRLKHQSPTGVYVLPAADSLRRWYGVIFVRKGHYRGGIFKFVVLIPAGYPDEAPRVHFLSAVFHPLIHPDTGLLDTSPQFPQWSGAAHYIVLLLSYVKKIFFKTELWEPAGRSSGAEPLNPRAQTLWLSNKEEYLRLCEQNAAKSASAEKLYGAGATQEDARCSLRFSRPAPPHEEAHRRIVQQQLERGQAGHSYADWFADGVWRLDNALGTAPTSLPPVAFEPPTPVSLSAAATAATAQAAAALGLKESPISPVRHSRDDSSDAGGAVSEDDAERAARVAALNVI